MLNLRKVFTTPLVSVPTSLVVAILALGVIGFIDSTYLTIEHYRGVIPPCSIVQGCDTVLTSSYSQILGIPVALLGSLYYLLISIGAFAYLEGKSEKIFRYSLILPIFGLLGSIWFTSIQIFVLESYCTYCLASALISLALFILSCAIFYRKTNVQQ